MKSKARRFLSGCLAALLLASAIPVEAASVNAQEVGQEEESVNSEILTEPEQASEEIQGTEQILEEVQEPEETPEQEGNAGAVLPGADIEVQPELKENPAEMNEQMEIVEELLGDDAQQALAGEDEDEGLPMVRLGQFHSAVVKTDGSLWMWGYNSSGQLGDGTTIYKSSPVKVLDGVKSVSLSGDYSAAIKTDGSLWMWGYNHSGQLGDGSTTNKSSPIKVLDGVKSVSLSRYGYSAAVKTDGSLWTWGANQVGQLGDGTFIDRQKPIKVMEDVKNICLDKSSAAIKTDGSLWTWGYNRLGQLGDGTTTRRNEPVKVMEDVKNICLGDSSSAAIKTDSSLWTWGGNRVGQLGDGTFIDRQEPIKIMENVKSISLYGSDTDDREPQERANGYGAAIKTDGSLWLWGAQPGDGTKKLCRSKPTKVMENVRSASLYGYGWWVVSSAVIKTDGSLWMWGYNSPEQLEDGTITNRNELVKVMENVKNVNLSGQASGSGIGVGASAAIKTDGSLWMWGNNGNGQLGDGTMENKSKPVKILDAGTSTGDDPAPPAPFDKIFPLAAPTAGTVGSPFTIAGRLDVKNDSMLSAPLQTEIAALKWVSSDPGIAEVTGCDAEPALSNSGADLAVTVTPRQAGTVRITGTASNGQTAVCEVRITDAGAVSIAPSLTGTEGTTVALSGALTISGSAEVTEEELEAAIENIAFDTTDAAVAKVIGCTGEQSPDWHSAELTVWVTLYQAGNVTITGRTASGSSSQCQVTIEADDTPDDTDYESDYSSKLSQLLNDEGASSTIEYLRKNENFTASSFIAENDNRFGDKVTMVLTDSIYRGWKGWKDLIDGSTSVEDAEKIIASLLEAYQVDCEALSKAKTAQKYGKMLSKSFSIYQKQTNMKQTLRSDALSAVTEYFSEDNIERLLSEGKYDELMAGPNLAAIYGNETPKEWNALMKGFSKSAEVSKKLEKASDTIGKAVKSASLFAETVNYYFQLESLLQADEMYCEMLLYLKENCVYSVVQDAAGNLYNTIHNRQLAIITDLLEEAAYLGAEKTLDFALKTACKCAPPMEIIRAGYEWGVLISNTFFKTGKTQELKDSLRTSVFLCQGISSWLVENLIDYRISIGTPQEQENAQRLYYSAYMLWKSRKCAEETLQSLVKTARLKKMARGYEVSVHIVDTLESFKNTLFSDENLSNLTGVVVSCPVDVEVYDPTGKKILTLRDGKETSGCKNGVYYFSSYNPLSDDYAKYVYFEKDAGHRIKIVGNGLGLVDCSVFQITDGGGTSEKYFQNIKTEKGAAISLDDVSSDTIQYAVTGASASGGSKTYTMEERSAEIKEATSLTLSATSLGLKVKGKKMITANILPADATDQKVVWSTSDKNVAVVNSDGVVTGVRAGTAVITASLDELSQKCKVTVAGSGQKPTPTPSLKPVNAKNQRSGKAYYNVSKKGAAQYVKPTKKNLGSVTIPSTVKIKGVTYKVTSIGNKAFINNKKLKKVTISDNITTIGNSAFQGCKALKTVTIVKRVKTIGQKAFYGDGKLRTITVKSTALKKVGGKALYGIHKKAVIKAPTKKLSAYKKLFKNKGQKKTVKFKKM